MIWAFDTAALGVPRESSLGQVAMLPGCRSLVCFRPMRPGIA
jgi:hypothetical protein